MPERFCIRCSVAATLAVSVGASRGVEPASEGATNWANVAREHPEFFRVSGESENKAISLLAKFALRKSDKEYQPHDLLTSLIDIAMKLNERQVEAEAVTRRSSYLPLWVAFIAGAFTLLATMLPRWFGH